MSKPVFFRRLSRSLIRPSIFSLLPDVRITMPNSFPSTQPRERSIFMPRAEKNSAISLTRPGRSGPIDEKTTYDLISQLRNFFRLVTIYLKPAANCLQGDPYVPLEIPYAAHRKPY